MMNTDDGHCTVAFYYAHRFRKAQEHKEKLDEERMTLLETRIKSAKAMAEEMERKYEEVASNVS